MRASILSISLGVVLLIAGVAGLVVVPEHAPSLSSPGSIPIPGTTNTVNGLGLPTVVGGWSQTVYDIARVTTWALLIIGAIPVMGLIKYARRAHAA